MLFNKDQKFPYNLETITKHQKAFLVTKPDSRGDEEITSICRALQWLDEFTYYSLPVQRQLAKHIFFECYRPDRIIFREGNHSDFMYFVLKGTLIYKGKEGTSVIGRGIICIIYKH